MNNIGETLKRAREARGLTLADMQRQTKIQMKYLDALENNNVSLLPSERNQEAFIRAYAEALDLDLAQLLDESPASAISEQPELAPEPATAYPEEESESEVDTSYIEDAQPEPTVSSDETSVSFDEPIGFVVSGQDEEAKAGVGSSGDQQDFETEEMNEQGQAEDEEVVADLDQQPESNATDESIEADREEELEEKAEEDLVLSRHARRKNEEKQEEQEDELEEEVELENRSFFERYGCLLIVIMLFIIAGLMLYFYFTYEQAEAPEHLQLDSSQAVEETVGEEPSKEEASKAESEEASSLPEEAESASPAPVTVEQVSADGSQASYHVQAVGVETLEVKLSTSSASAWASIEADGEMKKQGNIDPGESMTVKLPNTTSRIDIAVGQADITEIEINGQAVAYPEENAGNPTQYLSFEIES